MSQGAQRLDDLDVRLLPALADELRSSPTLAAMLEELRQSNGVGFAGPKAAPSRTLLGIPFVVSKAVPDGEVWLMRDGKRVGKIVGLGS